MDYGNDYELLYLIQSEQDSIALECLFKKYEKLIWRYIRQYNVPSGSHDDYFQEGIICLHKAAISFVDGYDKTFTRYFELILKRRYWALLKKEYQYSVCEEIDEMYSSPKSVESDFIIEEQSSMLEDKLSLLSSMEYNVYKLYFEQNKDISAIAHKLGMKVNSVYNAIFRIKKKLN